MGKIFLSEDNNDNISYRFILTEDIDAMRKFYKNIPDEKFMDFIKLDPTYRGGNNAGTYARWILGLADKGVLDNIGHVKDLLSRFEDSKKSLVTKDIMKFKSMDELETFLNDDASYKDTTHRQDVRQRQKDRAKADLEKEADLVYEDSDWEVWIPHTYAASCKLGNGARWCTASTESDYYYNYYRNNYGGEYYININKHNPDEKYQFHFESGQFMDGDDDRIDLKDFLNKNEGIKEFYKDKIRAMAMKSLEGFKIEGDIATSVIAKDDIAEAVSKQDKREGLPESFVRSILTGDYFDAFEFFDSYSSVSYREVEAALTQEELDRIKRLFESRNGDDEDYKELNDSEKLEYILKNDNDIDSAIASAWQDASMNGAGEEAERDIIGGIVENIEGEPFTKIDIWNGGEDYSLFEFSVDKYVDNYFDMVEYIEREKGYDYSDLYGTNAFIEDYILTSIENGNTIYEPRYGWYGFDEDTFHDELSYRLEELE